MDEVIRVAKERVIRESASRSEEIFVDLPDKLRSLLLPSDKPVCGIQKDPQTWTLICYDRVVARFEGEEQRLSLRQMDRYLLLAILQAKLDTANEGKERNTQKITGSKARPIWVGSNAVIFVFSSIVSFLELPAVRLGLLDLPAEKRPYHVLPSDEEWQTEGGRFAVDQNKKQTLETSQLINKIYDNQGQ